MAGYLSGISKKPTTRHAAPRMKKVLCRTGIVKGLSETPLCSSDTLETRSWRHCSCYELGLIQFGKEPVRGKWGTLPEIYDSWKVGAVFWFFLLCRFPLTLVSYSTGYRRKSFAQLTVHGKLSSRKKFPVFGTFLSAARLCARGGGWNGIGTKLPSLASLFLLRQRRHTYFAVPVFRNWETTDHTSTECVRSTEKFRTRNSGPWYEIKIKVT